MNETNVITDRNHIAETLTTKLNELDHLRSELRSTQHQVQVAQDAETAAAEVYAAKISEVLATGWATPQGLAAQGHEIPKKRGAAARAKRLSNGAAAEQGSPDDQQL
jgi:DNA-binding protein H-NS